MKLCGHFQAPGQYSIPISLRSSSGSQAVAAYELDSGTGRSLRTIRERGAGYYEPPAGHFQPADEQSFCPPTVLPLRATLSELRRNAASAGRVALNMLLKTE
ncbi:MAG: hypothetical protein ACRD1N_06410 [Terriglobia bacterium]